MRRAPVAAGRGRRQRVATGADTTETCGPVDVSLAASTTYAVTATFDPAGTITISLKAGGVDVTGSPLTANVSGGFAFNLAGFIVGRDDDGQLTCVDDLSINQ